MTNDQKAALDILAKTLSGYKALRKEGWPELKLVALVVTQATGLDTCAPAQGEGWVRCASHKMTFDSTDKTFQPNEMPLTGEWLVKDEVNTSVHLRPDPHTPGKLATWTYCHREITFETALEEGEVPALRQSICVLKHADMEAAAKKTEQDVLLYDVYWGGQGHELRRLCARFAGFAQKTCVSAPVVRRARKVD